MGGGALLNGAGEPEGGGIIYPFNSMQEILAQTEREGSLISELVGQYEGEDFWDYLDGVWEAMKRAIERGLNAEGKLPGALHVQRKASDFHARAQNMAGYFGQTALLFAYALAVSEENASGGEIVTAPTCGSCGVLPAVLCFLQKPRNL